MSTVADQFAEILAMSGVKRIYGVVGDSLNGITGGRAGEVLDLAVTNLWR
jgi:thiamine pyrophosphate-dependent acetolactate synthase large subunit-like protein